MSWIKNLLFDELKNILITENAQRMSRLKSIDMSQQNQHMNSLISQLHHRSHLLWTSQNQHDFQTCQHFEWWHFSENKMLRHLLLVSIFLFHSSDLTPTAWMVLNQSLSCKIRRIWAFENFLSFYARETLGKNWWSWVQIAVTKKEIKYRISVSLICPMLVLENAFTY